MKQIVILGILFGIVWPLSVHAEQKRGSSTHLAIPRFVSLSAPTANMRIGPSEDHVIDWVYRRRNLPLMVVGEHDSWRQVRDHEATEGWMHRSLLSSKRTVIVMNAIQRLKKEPDAESATLLRVEQGVLGEFEHCAKDWCLVIIDEQEGWIRRSELWGILPSD